MNTLLEKYIGKEVTIEGGLRQGNSRVDLMGTLIGYDDKFVELADSQGGTSMFPLTSIGFIWKRKKDAN